MAEQRPPRKEANERKQAASKKKGKRRKITGRKTVAVLFFTAAIAIVCGIIGYLLIILNGERILSANSDKFVMEEASTIYDVNGVEVAKLSRINRDSVDLGKVPELLRNAFIATEDRRFYEHSGVDFFSIGRAVVKDVIARSAVEGGSTITQQLAKNLFLTHDKTFFRKASEASIAVALEKKMTKDQILEMYLNRIYFGHGAYGIQAASEYYFGVEDLTKLKLWQMATLAGTPKAPNNYNPITDPERSRSRMAVVLQLMLDQKLIDAQQVADAKAEALKYKQPADTTKDSTSESYSTFTDFAINEAEKVTDLTEEQLRLGGYNIYTTLNTKAQGVMQKEFNNSDNFEKSPDDQIEQGAMIIIDHRTGEIEALVGSRDYEAKGLNRVYQDPRQPGSSFKPIVDYGPALETGDWFPWSTLRDDNKCYGSYCPSDSNGNKFIGPISMRQSIKESRNASAVWLLNEIGIQHGLDFAKTLGFNLDPQKDRNLAVALGGLTNGVTPMQMATAFSVFANGGKSVDPHSIVKITSKDGTAEYEYSAPHVQQLIKPETAWYLTDILQGVLEKGGTGTSARIDRPVAGKTGTTQHGITGLKSNYNRDAWFVGYTPEWTAAVWMGYPKTDAQHLLKRSSVQAAEMFAKVMSQSLKGVPVGQFIKPQGVKDLEKPEAVSGFTVAYDATLGGNQLTWSPVQDDKITYRVYRRETSESGFTLLLDNGTATSAQDLSVQPGLTYEYYVTTYNANSDSEGTSSTHMSAAVPAVTLDPVPGDPLNPEGNQPNNGQDNGGVDPGTVDPGTGDPGTTDPGTGDPGTGDPGTGAGDPGTTDPGTTDPGTTDPGTTDPGAGDPGTTDPGSNGPGSGANGSTEAPGTGQNGGNRVNSDAPNSGDSTGSTGGSNGTSSGTPIVN